MATCTPSPPQISGARTPTPSRLSAGSIRQSLLFSFLLHLVIGRGGEQINKIQQDSGCKVQISPGMSEPDVCQNGCWAGAELFALE